MKILLAKPVCKDFAHQTLGPDIGFGYLLTQICEKAEVSILDCPAERIGFEDFKNYILRNRFQIVGFKTFSKDLPSLIKSVEILKEMDPKIITITGGPHPSGIRGEILKQIPLLDFAFTGEAEISFSDLIDRIQNSEFRIQNLNLEDISGLIYRDNNCIKENPPYFIENLDELGLPSWSLINLGKYKKFSRVIGPYVPIVTTRGCPYNCTYCSAHTLNSRKIRYHSCEYIIEEIELLNKTYDVSHFAIADDNFTFNKEFVKKICNKIIQKNLRITWDCASNGVRVDKLDEEVLKIMEKSGCTAITVAVESGSDRILKLMKKEFDLKTVKEKIELIKRTTNMQLEGFFILGYPEENEFEIKKTINISRKLNLDIAEFFLFTPHPGSEIFEKLYKDKKMDWKSFDYNKISITPEGVSKPKLKFYQFYAYISFYLRPKIFLRLILRNKFNLIKFHSLLRRILALFGIY